MDPSSVDSRLLHALKRAVEHPLGGHVVVRHGVASSRVTVSCGQVAWVHAPALGTPFGRVLIEQHGVPEKALAAAVERCKAEGKPLESVLLEHEVLPRGELVRALHGHLAGRLATLLSLRAPGVSFVPHGAVRPDAKRPVELLFPLDALMPG